MDDFVLAGVPVAVVIALVVQMAKDQGFPARFCWPLAVVLGILCGFVGEFIPNPTLEGGTRAVVLGILAGSAASGMYSGQKAVRAG